MDTIGKRLKEILRRMLYNQRRFAEETGIAESNLSNVIKDKAVLSLSMKDQIAAKFPNINIDWLELGPGHGDPFHKEASETKEASSPRFWDEVALVLIKEYATQGLPPEKAAAKAGQYADAIVKIRAKVPKG